MRDTRVGVAMATYNGERYIRPQLDSIFAQERMPDRMVIVDDASTDATPRILDEYARRHPGIVRVAGNRQNRGAPYTFAKAMSQCDTHFIALADQDDEWLPGKLAALLAAAAENPGAGMWFHDLAIINPQGETRAESFWAVAPEGEPLPVAGSDARARIARYSNPVPGCTMFIDAAMREKMLPFPSPLVGHDWWISAVCFFLGAPCVVDARLGRYRLHPHQVAGIGTRLERRRNEKLQLPLHEKVWWEVKRLWHRRRKAAENAQRRREVRNEKASALLLLLDRALGGHCPADRVDEYRRLREEIISRGGEGL
ncbi:MAG: glycosyltransferase [Pseudomonadota bacterium]